MQNPYNPQPVTGLILSQHGRGAMAQVYSRTDQHWGLTFPVALSHWWHHFIMFNQIQIYFRMWRQNSATAPSSCPGGLENLPLTKDNPENLNPNLLLCNEQPGPESQVLDLEYLPYYRTSHICVCPAAHICTEREKSSNEGKASTKQDENVSYSATPQDIFHTAGLLKSFLASHSYRLHIWLNWVNYLQIRLKWTYLECFLKGWERRKRSRPISHQTVTQNSALRNKMTTCALKTQNRSRAICKDKIPEAAL